MTRGDLGHPSWWVFCVNSLLSHLELHSLKIAAVVITIIRKYDWAVCTTALEGPLDGLADFMVWRSERAFLDKPEVLDIVRVGRNVRHGGQRRAGKSVDVDDFHLVRSGHVGDKHRQIMEP
jgi:hypothetical protein